MLALTRLPLEQWLSDWFGRLALPKKHAFLAAAAVSLLSFGFEMTNLTLHHDDLTHLMVNKPLVGYYLGRFVHTLFFFYVQQGHFSPFLHMTIGMALMCACGVLIAHFLGGRRSLDLALAATVVCVFPYMAHIYQYNSAMVAYPLAHLLAAAAVVLAARGQVFPALGAALLFFLAFSIYQAVLANAATLFLLWLLTCCLLGEPCERDRLTIAGRATVAALGAVMLGGILHVLVVSSLNIPFDSAQGADKAFSLRSRMADGLQLSYAWGEVLHGSRAFFFWPEAYLPQPLKALHALLLATAALGCLLLPRGLPAKVTALGLFGLALFAPRAMQFLHPQGTFHKLTLSAYALVIAAAILIALRTGGVLMRNATVLAAALLIAGYVAQSNWISTVNYLNTMAHFSTTTQILARVRSLPDQNWDGRTIVVVGSSHKRPQFPFWPATGVASQFLNAGHLTLMARLLRDEASFIAADAATPSALEFAANREAWPAPDSVGIVDGRAVVVLSTVRRGEASNAQHVPSGTSDSESN